MRKTAYKAGKTIVREGERGDEAYIIVDGKVEVTRRTSDGSEIILANLVENHMFGEVSLIDDTIRRTATVKALTDVVVAVITQESFIEKMQATPVAIKSIMKVLAKRLADTDDMLISLHSQIELMVSKKVGEVIERNKIMKDTIKNQEQKIEELEAEIEKLKITGPPKAPPKPASATGQKLEKDRSMKISLKDLDQMAKKHKEDNS